MDLRIYYIDEVYEGPVENIPSPVGVVAIAIPQDVTVKNTDGRLVVHSAEYYICLKGYWYPCQTLADLVDHVLFSKPDCVLKGRWVPDDVWNDIIYRASKDRGMPIKSGVRYLRETGLEEASHQANTLRRTLNE